MIYTTYVMTSKQIYMSLLMIGLIAVIFLVWYIGHIQVIAQTDEIAVLMGAHVSTTVIHPFMQALSQSQNSILIDIRTPEEFQAGHIPGAINVDFYDPLFLQNMQRAANGRSIFMYCRSGSRSNSAYRQLRGLGLEVTEMRGGILSYTGVLVKD